MPWGAILILFFAACRNAPARTAAAGTDSTPAHPPAILKVAAGSEIFIDTVMDGDTLQVQFAADTAMIRWNNTVTRLPVYCDHDERGVIGAVADPGRAVPLIFSGNTGAVGFLNYQDMFMRRQFFLFRIDHHALVFLDYDKGRVFTASAPVLHEKDLVYTTADNQLLLLNYHSRRETKEPSYDSSGHYRGQLDGDERYYNFTRINLQSGKAITFNLAGTGNEFATAADFNKMMSAAASYRR